VPQQSSALSLIPIDHDLLMAAQLQIGASGFALTAPVSERDDADKSR
jgi:hypothetical protein